jgi:regulatory protein
VPDIDERLQRALDLCYAYVNQRDRTVSEVRRHLERKAVAGELIEASLRTLVDQGLLDDARFVRLFVSDKRELEQWGSERIRRGLLSRGIERCLAEQVSAARHDNQENEPTELDRALALLRRRFPSPPRDRRERERALGVLLRKGYESELALDALAAHARGGAPASTRYYDSYSD